MVLVPSTSLPLVNTQRTFASLSRITISASLPFSNVPLESAIPVRRAGVSEAILTASSRGMPAFLTIVCTRTSAVAILPAKV